MESRVISRVPDGYAEYPPPLDLAACVVCAWTRRASSADIGVYRVLPDGCTDILFAFGAGARPGSEGIDASVVGAMTRPIVVPDPHPRLYVGVRLAPGYAQAAFRVPASELTDQRVEYALVERDAMAHVAALEGVSDEACVGVAFEIVRRRLAQGGVVPRSVRAAVRRIVAAGGNLRIASLAGDLGVTRQQLARHFAAHVGLTPKMLARVMRARAALARAHAARAAYPRNVNWSAIAQELGYYDQPHFIDDFKELTGQTPREWLG